MTDQCLTIEQLQAYIAHEPGSTQAEAFEHHLASCELCSSALEAIEQAMESEVFDAARFRSMEQEFVHEVRRKATQRTTGVQFYKIAALVLLMLNVGTLAYFGFNRSASNQEFQAYHFNQRGGLEQTDQLLQHALSAYENRDYAAALQKLDQLPDRHPQAELILFLKGNAYAATGQDERAIAEFEQILAEKDWTLYRSEVRRSLKLLY